MKKEFLFGLGLLIMLSTVMTSCIGEGSEISYLPFKSSKDGKWGLMGADGKVLFEEEFKDAPTSVKNGRFMIENGNGKWEIYTAEHKPVKIGEEYLEIADFTADVTPSVKPNEKIKLIDKDGKVKATLDKIGNKNIVSCTKFTYGIAEITVEDGKHGAINTNGEVVVEPKYDQVYACSENKFIVMASSDNNDGVSNLKVIKGKDVLCELKIGEGQKFVDASPFLSTEDYLAVCSSIDGEKRWGYINMSKEIVIKPTEKISYISGVRGNYFIFYNGENYGIMNFEGETVLRAKYDGLMWADDDVLIAYDSSSSRYNLIDLEGNKITKEEYKSILPFYDGQHAAVQIDDNSWGFINKKGEEIKMKNAPDIYEIADKSAVSIVNSDYFDIDAIVSKLNLSKNGLMGYNLNMNPLQIVKNYNELSPEKLELNPEQNQGRDRLEITFEDQGVNIHSKVYYTLYLTKYVNGNYIWSDEKPDYVEAKVSGNKLSGKTDMVYSKVSAIVKSFGKTMKENSRAVIVKLSDSQGWVVINDGTDIYISLKNNNSYQSIDIDSYAKNEESTRVYEEAQKTYDDSQQSEGGSQQTNSSATYRGKIGKWDVTMVLNPYVAEDEVAGSYVYDNNGVTTRFTLVVRERAGDRLVISEHRPSDGFQSGTFEGNLSNGGGTYSGNFYNSEGKGFAFTLYRD